MERGSRRPDLFAYAVFGEQSLWVIPGIAAAIVGVPVLVVPGIGPLAGAILGLAVLLSLLRPAPHAPGAALWAAAIALPFASVMTDFVVGEVDTYVEPLTAVAVFTALWRTARLESATVLRLAKGTIGLFVLASGVLALAGTPGSTAPYGQSIIPGMDVRVSGAFYHANHLGPAAVTYLVLEWIRPSRPWVRGPMVLMAAVLVLVAQSKTAWVAAAVVAVLLVASRWDQERALAVCGLAAGALVAIAVAAGTRLTDVLQRLPVDNVETLTGRTNLWELGLEAWGRSPIFGQGSTLFSRIAEETQQDWAGQAHNEYVAALAEHGVFGLAAILLLAGLLLHRGLRHSAPTRNGSLALVAVLLTRSLTEARLGSVDLLELTVLAALFAWEREEAGRRRREPARQLPTAASRS